MSEENHKKAEEALRAYVLWKVYVLYHIPFKYFLPNCPEHEHLGTLAEELDSKGHIQLDRDRNPCCLSGEEPAVSDAVLSGRLSEE